MSEYFGVSTTPAPKPAPVPQPVRVEPAPQPAPQAAKKKTSRRPGPAASITRRRAEVLDLLIEGCSNTEIGKRLGVTPATAKNHIAESLRLLGARNRTQAAVRWALKRQAEKGAQK